LVCKLIHKQETEELELFSKQQVKEMELAFDHKKMLRDAKFIEED